MLSGTLIENSCQDQDTNFREVVGRKRRHGFGEEQAGHENIYNRG
jgi:hypothetical protein